MSRGINLNSLVIFTVSVSIFGLAVALMLALFPPAPQQNLLLRKPFVGSIFALICIFGITAVFFPERCSEASHSYKTGKSMASKAKTPHLHEVSITLKGHHPDCGRFSEHVVRINRRVFCAACMGLFLGAIMALFGTGFCFFGGYHVEGMSFAMVLIGIPGVILGFLQLMFRGFVRLMLNAFFVLATFLILNGVDDLAQSLFVDLFLVVLIVFWLSTRMVLSQWDHWKICHRCKLSCEVC